MKKVSHLLGRAIRETGQAVDRLALRLEGKEAVYNEFWSRHRPVMNLFDKRPLISSGTFIASNASVIGEVLMNDHASVWYGAVVRGDKSKVTIGFKSNVQDRCVVSTVPTLDSGFSADVEIGEYCTVGHGAILVSCTIKRNCLIGQGSIIQEGAVIEENSIIAAGAVILADTIVPAKQLWAGNPAKFVRNVTDDEVENNKKVAENYTQLATEHDAEFLPFGTVYQHAEKVANK